MQNLQHPRLLLFNLTRVILRAPARFPNRLRTPTASFCSSLKHSLLASRGRPARTSPHAMQVSRRRTLNSPLARTTLQALWTSRSTSHRPTYRLMPHCHPYLALHLHRPLHHTFTPHHTPTPSASLRTHSSSTHPFLCPRMMRPPLSLWISAISKMIWMRQLCSTSSRP